MTLTAAADGSSLGNPGPAGWAWYVDDDCWAAGGWESSTNNRGELTAVLELLRATEAAGLAGEELLIQCDSQYVINSLTKWRHGWKKRGWRKADGKPVLNADLVKDLDAALAGLGLRNLLDQDRCLHDVLQSRHVGEEVETLEDHADLGALSSTGLVRQGVQLSATTALDLTHPDELAVDLDPAGVDGLQLVDATQKR